MSVTVLILKRSSEKEGLSYTAYLYEGDPGLIKIPDYVSMLNNAETPWFSGQEAHARARMLGFLLSEDSIARGEEAYLVLDFFKAVEAFVNR